MPKKSLKTNHQISVLTRYFHRRSDKWPKQEVINIGREIGLSRAKVYKWLWDQRNLLRNMEKKNPHSNSENKQRIFESMININTQKKYKKVTLKCLSQELTLDVPDTVEFALKWRLPLSTPKFYTDLLRLHGCQLMKFKSPSFIDSPEKKESLVPINEFRQVKEEFNSPNK